MIRLASFVLRRADLIKLLYDSQLTGFDLNTRRVPVHRYFDLVDTHRFLAGRSDHRPIVLFVGLPFWRKGIDLLLQAWSELHADFQQWQLVLIGWGLKDAAAAAGLPVDNVQFTGPQPSEKVAEWMSRASIFVLPSRSEAMGRVLIEAAAAGVVRLGARIEGIPTVIEDGSDGVLFHPGDATDLQAKLRALMGDRQKLLDLGAAARRRLLADFTEEVYLDRLGAALRECAAPPK